MIDMRNRLILLLIIFTLLIPGASPRAQTASQGPPNALQG